MAKTHLVLLLLLLCFVLTVSGQEFDCDFQDGFCGWSQSSDDDTNWVIEKGNTDSAGTGPTYDRDQCKWSSYESFTPFSR